MSNQNAMLNHEHGVERTGKIEKLQKRHSAVLAQQRVLVSAQQPLVADMGFLA